MKKHLATMFALLSAVGIILPAFGEDYTVISSEEAADLGGATGGDEVRQIDNGDGTFDLIHIITSVGANTLTVGDNHKIVANSFRFLVVGGGGSGGVDCGGGGGAGEFLAVNGLTLTTGSTTATVGGGGAAVAVGGAGSGSGRGVDGSPSTLVLGGETFTARGGGGGGSWNSSSGRPGGSGGGGCGYSSQTTGGAATAVDPGKGHAGGGNGSTHARRPAGGGGGAGGVGGTGTSTPKSGAGGPGLSSDISGETQWYAAGGGGGGANQAGVWGAGGSGIGGDGTSLKSERASATAGAANTGSGGGGGAGGDNANKAPSGAGGSGIVIVRYTVDLHTYIPTSDGESIRVLNAETNWVDGDLVLKFADPYEAGDLKLPTTVDAWVLAVGGGGAGANPGSTGATRGSGGGGGAGGFVEKELIRLSTGTYVIGVGDGGAAAAAATVTPGANGEDSYIQKSGSDVLRALGGGGGGMGNNTTGNGPGRSGGSGGGGSYYSSSYKYEGGAGLQPTSASGGYGSKGGTGGYYGAGAGGGGAGGAGEDVPKNNTAGKGGDGRLSTITGVGVTYAAGGGGGSRTGTQGQGGSDGIGGSGGGGASSAPITATSGRNGTGSGGGGGSLNRAGGSGGSGVVIIRIRKIMPMKPAPTVLSWEYDGQEHAPIDVSAASHIRVVSGTAAATEVGDYTLTVAPADGYVWSDGTTTELTFNWHITKPTLIVDSLTIRGWQLKMDPNDPVLVVKTAEGIVVSLPEENVKFKWRVADGEWSEGVLLSQWREVAETLGVGEYDVTADIIGTASYDPPTVIPTASLSIWAGRPAGVDGLAYSCDLTITGYMGQTLTSAPLLVEIAEDIPEGFTYRHAQPDGSDIRFVDQGGNILKMQKMIWNPDGASIFVVEVPDFAERTMITMCWGQMVDEDNNDIVVPDAPALTQQQPLYHFDFNGRTTNSGTATLTMNNDGGRVGQYEKTGVATDYAAEDQAVWNWTGNSTGSHLTLPTGGYSIATYAKISPTVGEGEDVAVVWAIGSGHNTYPSAAAVGGFALVSKTDGTIRVVAWENQSGPVRTVLETKVNQASTAYHQYRVNLSANHEEVELLVDGKSVGFGTLEGKSVKSGSNVVFQFGSVYGDRPPSMLQTLDTRISDWTLYAPASVDFRVSPVYITEDARLKNYWVREPTIGAREWGTGQEPTPEMGQAAYGDSYFEIAPVGGDPLPPNTFPSSAGSYTVTFRADAGATSLVSWGAIAFDDGIVNVTAHSPFTDLGGTASGRVLLANDYVDERAGQSILGQTYETTSGDIAWVHSDEKPNTRFPNLKTGYNHTLALAEGRDELCGGTNLWTLSGVYLGSTKGYTFVLPDGRRPIFFPETDLNETHLVMRNVVDAEIRSACLTNGIGTVYFDAVNGWQDATGTNYAVRVEYVEGVITDPEEYAYVTSWQVAELHPYFHDSDGTEDFTALAATTNFSFNATRAYDEGSFYRVYAPINVRGPVTFRIRRTSSPGSDIFGLDQAGFIILDNIIASTPASRVDLSPGDTIDPNKREYDIVGFEGGVSGVPSMTGEVLLHATATMTRSPGQNDPEILSAKAHYRYRHLAETNDWADVSLNVSTLTAATPATLPTDRADGDLEFFYTLTANAPYYKYYDYSGLSLPFDAHYSEECAVVTNRYEATSALSQSWGTDWFVRLKRHAVAHHNLFVEATDSQTNAITVTYRFDTAEHTWRAYIPTDAPDAHGLRVRLGYQDAGVTNMLKVAHNVDELPASISVSAGTTNDWFTVICDAATGGLMLQLDESTATLTVAHADFQNGNKWNDAHATTFVGNSTLMSARSGVSSKMRDCKETFATWTDTPAANPLWKESFTDGTGDFSKWSPFVPFTSHETPNGWVAGPGMFVNETYRPTTKVASGAYQMEGQGKGYLEYPGLTTDPRGVDTFSYKTRLAQTMQFTDFGWKYVDNPLAWTNYTFATQVVLTDATWKEGSNVRGSFDFDGAGQVSLVACYQPMVGCYEFRITAMSNSKPRLELYKWTVANGVYKATQVNVDDQHDGGADIFRAYATSTSAAMQYPLAYISVEKFGSAMRIMAGFSTNHEVSGSQPSGYRTITYWDATPGKLTSGSYGLSSANCNAFFISPRLWSEHLPWLGGTNPGADRNKTAPTWPSSTKRSWEQPDLTEDHPRWVLPNGRLARITDKDKDRHGTARWGIKADVVAQPIVIQYKVRGGKDGWQTLKEEKVEGFLLSSLNTIKLQSVKDATFRIAHAATPDDAKTDVVLDDVEIRQWRGDDYGSADTASFIGTDADYGFRTNVVFTSGWIKDHTVQLSAKRTLAGTPCSIRSPLFDGAGGRGVGLGMVSFRYKNAQANAKLLVQIATNNVAGTIRRETSSLDASDWTTITNFTFTAEQPDGTKSCYLGLHGVKGLIRILMDPAVVAAVENETNEQLYGSIDIEEILFRDEPMLDLASWWGWNINTFTDRMPGGPAWGGGRLTYLPDAEAGLSMILNNSVTADIVDAEKATYPEHLPFIQTPTFTSNVVGEVTFNARMFDEGPQKAEVWLYGARTGDANLPDDQWHLLKHFTVSNTWYETYHYRSKDATDTYRAFRLAVVGVPGATAVGEWNQTPKEGPLPVRVAIDDIFISEAVYPTVGFRYAYPIHTDLEQNVKVAAIDELTGLPLPEQQPLLGENWTLQAEIEAKQLPEEIDWDTPGREPRVFFHWYPAKNPWGYENWTVKASAKPHVAELVRAEGETHVFRGSFAAAPTAIVDEVDPSEASYAVCQYTASVVYWDKSGDVHTNRLNQAQWEKPAWYDPVDYNEKSLSFSPYTILETVAPYRAWINEANVYDNKDGAKFIADNNQYIEIAVPSGQSLQDWKLEYVMNSLAQTNTLFRFGTGLAEIKPMKTDPMTNDYVFIVVASPATDAAGTWENVYRPDGRKVEIDGTWKNFDDGGGLLNQTKPFALRLMRPSGIAAHEIVLEGRRKQDTWAEIDGLQQFFMDITEISPKSHYLIAGSETDNEPVTGLEGRSLGVITEHGATSNDWTSARHQTPGWCNEGQIVPEDYAIFANGAMVVITARIEGGYLVQTFGEAVDTAETVRLTTLKGGPGTNIVYTAAAWHELASVTTNGIAIAELPAGEMDPTGARRYVVTVGKGCSNSVNVVAATRPWSDLAEKYGLDPKNRYAPAVMRWLEGGQNFWGTPFAKPGEVNLGEYWSYKGTKVSDLSLLDMYWLDIDPTEGNWRLVAGVSEAPHPVVTMANRARFLDSGLVGTNDVVASDAASVELKIYMSITNTETAVNFAPYVLRGVEPDQTSYDYSQMEGGVWGAESFKITGDLQNGNPERTRWAPLKYYYFLPDASAPNKSASFDANNEATIEIADPYAVPSGWSNYRDCMIFYGWAIDERQKPVGIVPLLR